jgi:hypothetical protein
MFQAMDGFGVTPEERFLAPSIPNMNNVSACFPVVNTKRQL